MEEKHIFALFLDQLSHQQLSAPSLFFIKNPLIIHRINNIIRLKKNDAIILFDRAIHMIGFIEQIEYSSCAIQITEIIKNIPATPHIRLLLPLLKKEALEEAVYMATVLGVTQIFLLKTKKSLSKLADKQMIARLEKICISGAEQSKIFFYPTIEHEQSFTEFFDKKNESNEKRIWFDMAGEKISHVLQNISITKNDELVVGVGPEGDLVDEERSLLIKNDFKFSALTGSVLRSEHAIMVGIGIIRSFYH